MARIDQMPMTYQAVEMKMSWCLDCHRKPESRLVSIPQVTKPGPDPHASTLAVWHPPVMTGPEKARMTNCTVCHR